MDFSETSKAEEVRADIVVIGGGGAGLAAAVAAAENGANNILILEARRNPGGNAVFPVGIFAAESMLQKYLHIDAERDELFRKALDYAHWKNNPRLLRVLVDKSGDTIRWLEEKGVKFVRILPLYPNQVPTTFHVASGPGTTGAAVIKALINNCKDLGVQILCQTEAKRILTSEEGKVTGVLAGTEDKELRIIAKSVIIATGGFAGNKELLKIYLPSYDEEEMHHSGIPHKGDGVRMATEIGAAMEGMVTLEMEGPYCPWSSYLASIVRRPNTIWVNKMGERFTDETIAFLFPEAANSIYRQPGKISYTLFDEKIKQAIIEEGLGDGEELILKDGSWSAGVDKDLQLQIDKGRVKISDSWNEIGRWIGAAPEVLKNTIDEYNSFCDRGYDGIFAKNRRYLVPLRTPPYYAIQGCLNLLTTHGGIKINHHMEVLNHQDKPICGLYAAGVETGGTDSDTYNVILTGHSFGFTINSGRIAGENAARCLVTEVYSKT